MSAERSANDDSAAADSEVYGYYGTTHVVLTPETNQSVPYRRWIPKAFIALDLPESGTDTDFTALAGAQQKMSELLLQVINDKTKQQWDSTGCELSEKTIASRIVAHVKAVQGTGEFDPTPGLMVHWAEPEVSFTTASDSRTRGSIIVTSRLKTTTASPTRDGSLILRLY
jgi:hypothetical protein